MPNRRAIVISDLHLGSGPDHSSFVDGKALVRFLSSIDHTLPTELVLAGDTFDILFTPGYAGFDRTTAIERLDSILRGKDTADVLAAVRKFAQHSLADVTVLAGNHEVELFLPGVRTLFEEAIARRGSVRWADDAPLLARDGEHPPVRGHALGAADGCAWILHGDRFDPFNAVDADTIREAASTGAEVKLPPGSELVYSVLADLRPEYPWIDTIKPDEAVIILLMYLKPSALGPFLRGRLNLTRELLVAAIRAKLRSGPLFGEAGGQAKVDSWSSRLSEPIAQALANKPAGEQDILLAELAEQLDSKHRPPRSAATLSARSDICRLLAVAALTRVRDANAADTLDGPDDLPIAADKYIPENVLGVIAGHTHRARYRWSSRTYANTGTWLPIARIPEGNIEEHLRILQDGAAWPSVAPRTFADVRYGDCALTIRIGRCDAEGRVEGSEDD